MVMLTRKLFRTAWRYRAQFVSMVIMVALGVGVFLGFNMEWYSLDRDTSALLSSTDYADFRIYSDDGFTDDDIDAIRAISGVSAASRVLSVNVGVKGTDKSLSLFCPEDYTVSKMVITSGADYDRDSDGF
jgi:putative ABC transport system permease protein